jgi:hypothetical protein
MLKSLLVISILIAIDYQAISFCANYFVRKKFLEQSLQNKYQIITMAAFYSIRIILFTYLLLFDLGNPFTVIVSRVILFPIFVYSALVIIIFKKNFPNIKKILSSILLSTVIFYVICLAGENSWDGSAYHLPIELIIRDYGSLWGWPEVIFNQWGLIGGDIANSLFHITFGSARAGLLPTVIYTWLAFRLIFSLKMKYRALILIILFSIPSLVNQIGTRYIDSLLAISLFLLYFATKISKEDLNKRIYFLIFCISAFSFSIKLSALTGALCILILLFIEKKFTMREKIGRSIFLILGSIVGTFPIFFRNIIEHHNPFFPFYAPGFRNGYLSLTKFSDQLQNSYLIQQGSPNDSLLVSMFYQYILSPFITIYQIFVNIFKFQGESLVKIRETESFYRTFVYDNRLSGFGPSLLLLLIILFLVFRRKGLLYVIATFVFMISIPTSIHARYSLGLYLIGLIFLFNVVEERKSTVDLRKIWLRPILVVTLIFGVLNVGNVYFRMYPEGIKFYPEDRNTYKVAKFVNPDCSPIAHFGSGLWGGDSLWGPNLCGRVVASEYVNGYILDAALGPERINTSQIQKIKLLAAKYPENLRILCSTPSTTPIEIGITKIPTLKTNPCVKIFSILSDQYTLINSIELIEERVGPHLTVIKLAGNKD